ncbi:MAG: hypothetical protein C0582_01865 [Alphaproteobacteria bacterium]|nr:MAG: hypothetical protein C0582_01865 [Alphaproteobacteria bacterium]
MDSVDYCVAHSSPIPEPLAALRQAIEQTLPEQAHNMLSVQAGQTLALCLRLFQPKAILEIGTFAGYSTLWMALATAAEITTLDRSESGIPLARHFWRQADVDDRIEFVASEATTHLQALKEEARSFDCFFIDASKKDLQRHVEKCMALRSEGRCLLVVDNVLGFKGHSVLDSSHRLIQKITEFNHWLKSVADLSMTLLPVGDGLAVCYIPASIPPIK